MRINSHNACYHSIHDYKKLIPVWNYISLKIKLNNISKVLPL